MNSIGIMQGRLSAAEKGRFQFFPTDWMAEFSLAKKLGFDHLEWFLDRDYRPGFDPVGEIWGRPEELKKIDEARAILPISSVDCGTYGFFGAEKEATLASFPIFLPAAAPRLATGVVSLALLEKNAPKTEAEEMETRETLAALLKIAEPLGLRLALETEMPAEKLAAFIDSFNSRAIGATYDIGNNTSYGFDCPAEIRALGPRIFEVHFKDRKIGATQSLSLGTGDGDFTGCLGALREIGYAGVFTLQAWRGPDYLSDAKEQLAFARSL